MKRIGAPLVAAVLLAVWPSFASAERALGVLLDAPEGHRVKVLKTVAAPNGKRFIRFDYVLPDGRATYRMSGSWVVQAQKGTSQISLSRRSVWDPPRLMSRVSNTHQARVAFGPAPADIRLPKGAGKHVEALLQKLSGLALRWQEGPLSDLVVEALGDITRIEGAVGYGELEQAAGVGDPILTQDRLTTGPNARIQATLMRDNLGNRGFDGTATVTLGAEADLSVSSAQAGLDMFLSAGWMEVVVKGTGPPTLIGRLTLARTGRVLYTTDEESGVEIYYLKEGAAAVSRSGGEPVRLKPGFQATFIDGDGPDIVPTLGSNYDARAKAHLSFSKPKQAPMRWSAYARVTAGTGQVFAVRRGDDQPYLIHLGEGLKLGQAVATGDDGRATVEVFPSLAAKTTNEAGAFLYLGPNSKIRFHRATTSNSMILRGLQGAYQYLSNQLATKGTRIQVGNVVAVVDGTDFVTQFSEKTGKGAFLLKSGKITVQGKGASAALRPGQSIAFDATGVLGQPVTMKDGVYETVLAQIHGRKPPVAKTKTPPPPAPPPARPPTPAEAPWKTHAAGGLGVRVDAPATWERRESKGLQILVRVERPNGPALFGLRANDLDPGMTLPGATDRFKRDFKQGRPTIQIGPTKNHWIDGRLATHFEVNAPAGEGRAALVGHALALIDGNKRYSIVFQSASADRDALLATAWRMFTSIRFDHTAKD